MNILKLINILAVIFLVSCATNEKSTSISPKANPGTGAYFVEICDNPRSSLCVAFFQGFLTGQIDAMESVKTIDEYNSVQCKVKAEKNCTTNTYYLLSVLKQGCHQEMENLSWDIIIALLKEQISLHPELSNSSFSGVYSKTINSNFSCKKSE